MSSDDEIKPLRLLTKPVQLGEPRNYWNTSGLNREYFPTEPRPESIPTLNKYNRVLGEPKDPWWINSKDHNYCFWSYVRDKSQPDGTMEPLLQSEIAELFGCSSTKVHFMLKEAMDHLTTEENMQILQGFFEMTKEEPSDEIVPQGTINRIDKLNNDEDSE